MMMARVPNDLAGGRANHIPSSGAQAYPQMKDPDRKQLLTTICNLILLGSIIIINNQKFPPRGKRFRFSAEVREPAPPNGGQLSVNEPSWHSMRRLGTECARACVPARWRTRNEWKRMPDINNWTVTIKSFMDKNPITARKAHKRNGYNTLSLSVSAAGLAATEEFMRAM